MMIVTFLKPEHPSLLTVLQLLTGISSQIAQNYKWWQLKGELALYHYFIIIP